MSKYIFQQPVLNFYTTALEKTIHQQIMNDDQKTSERKLYTEPVQMQITELRSLVNEMNELLRQTPNSPQTHRFEIFQTQSFQEAAVYRIVLMPRERRARIELQSNIRRMLGNE